MAWDMRSLLKAGGCAAAVWAASVCGPAPNSTAAHGQAPVHYMHGAAPPPGAVGSYQLTRGGPIAGYFQPIELRGPQGLQVALAVEGQFEPLQEVPVRAGLQVAPVYRLRVSNVPLYPGQEVFPTIEVVDRLYPPVGREWQFPIPIELSAVDLELAIQGRFVTRIIYLEDPRNALPVGEVPPGEQRWQEAAPGTNPLLTADLMGRPIAILRMGGRVPDFSQGFEREFLGSGAPILKFRPNPGFQQPREELVPQPAAPIPTPQTTEFRAPGLFPSPASPAGFLRRVVR